MAISQQEIFGPVASIQIFTHQAEAIALANASQSGLAAYVFTKDAERIWQLSEQLQVGMIGINGSAISQAHIPFGGIKASGFGREGSQYGIDEYLQLKHLCWAN
jgi:succinate-semialdehyde dehydrogenase/glutarate-semialdehyde dehydrogenase